MKAALIALALMATPIAAETNLIANGNFTDGNYLVGAAFGQNKYAPIGWDVGSRYLLSPAYGLFNSPSPFDDAISQTFIDVPGTTYQVSFFYAVHDPVGGGGLGLYAFLNGAQRFLVANVDTSGVETFTFLASGADTLLLAGWNNPGGQWWVDLNNVAVVAVPEPTTWALLLFGFAFFGIKGIWP